MILTNSPAAIQLLLMVSILFTSGLILAAYFSFRRWIAARMLVWVIHPDRRLSKHMVRPESDGNIRIPKIGSRFLFSPGDVFYSSLPLVGEPIPAIICHIDKPEALDVISLVPKDGITSTELSSAFDNRMLEQWVRATKEPGIAKLRSTLIIGLAAVLLAVLGSTYFIATSVLGPISLLER